jgi:hypothetical protein
MGAKMLRLNCLVAASILALTVGSANANSVDVSYAVSGSPGNWLVDVTFTNNLGYLGPNYEIYFLGIQLPSTDIVNSPSPFASANNPWGPLPSGTTYNNNWCVDACINRTFGLGILPGQTVSGFEALDTDLSAPTSIQWFAYAFNDGGPGNPGFEGIAGTPLPAALPLFATGLGALGLLGWRRKRKNVAAITAA